MDLIVRQHVRRGESSGYSATARVPLPGCDLHARAEHSEIHALIVNLIRQLAFKFREQFPGGAPQNSIAPDLRRSKSARCPEHIT